MGDAVTTDLEQFAPVHVASEHGSCSGCLHRYPCPTRSLVAHLSWREQMKAAR